MKEKEFDIGDKVVLINALRQEIEYFDSLTLAKIIHEIVGTGFVCDIIEKCAEWEC